MLVLYILVFGRERERDRREERGERVWGERGERGETDSQAVKLPSNSMLLSVAICCHCHSEKLAPHNTLSRNF